MVGCSRQLCLALRNWPSPAHPGWARKAFRSSHVQPCVSPESSIGYNPIRIININNHTLAYCIYLETRKCGLRPKLVIFWSHLNSKSSPRAGPCPGTLRCPLAIQPFRQQRHPLHQLQGGGGGALWKELTGQSCHMLPTTVVFNPRRSCHAQLADFNGKSCQGWLDND